MARKNLVAGSLMALTLSISAQAEIVNIPVNWPDGTITTIVAHNRYLPGWIDAILGNYYIDYTFNGDASIVVGDKRFDRQQFVAAAEVACRQYERTSQPSVIVDIFGNVAVFFGIGYAYGPLVSQVNSAYRGMASTNSAAMGTSFGLSGLAGTLTSEGKRSASFYNCGTVLLDRNRPELGIHPISSLNF